MREYKLEIDPRILELLGPSLYTNVYYVLGELIANAFDADANNVWITETDTALRVEDDGHGMSYTSGDTRRYLQVAAVSRESEADSRTKRGRLRMGRKGVGKLAALSVSHEVDVLTSRGDERSGFVLTRKPPPSRLLEPIPVEAVRLEHVEGDGSAIVMKDPRYKLHRTLDAVERNLLRIFPIVSPDFRIHVIRGSESRIIESFDERIVGDLSSIIVIGDDFAHLASKVPDLYPPARSELVEMRAPIRREIEMKNSAGIDEKVVVEIQGWIGNYRSTAGRKKDVSDFPDNFLSLFSNGKLGEFNILPAIGANRVSESYVVGQLHVAAFEFTHLPDMALSNRQGYKSDDPRYEAVLEAARDLLAEVRRKRDKYVDVQGRRSRERETARRLDDERKLREDVDRYRTRATAQIVEAIAGTASQATEPIAGAVSEVLNRLSPDVGLKARVDSQKKKYLISHTGADADVAEVVYQMLVHNGVAPADVIFTNSADSDARIPHGSRVYDYLREFFVDSYSTQGILVLFITSKPMEESWGAVTEVGASWITRADHMIFTIDPYVPRAPLDNAKVWHTSLRGENGVIEMSAPNADDFCVKIEAACTAFGITPRPRSENLTKLRELVDIAAR